MVLTWSESRVLILIVLKPKSPPLRNYQQLHNQSLDSWDSQHSQEILNSFKTTNLNSLNLDSFKTQFLKKFLAVATPSLYSQKFYTVKKFWAVLKPKSWPSRNSWGWACGGCDRQTDRHFSMWDFYECGKEMTKGVKFILFCSLGQFALLTRSTCRDNIFHL